MEANTFPEEKVQRVQAEDEHWTQSTPYVVAQLVQTLLLTLKYQSTQVDEQAEEFRLEQMVHDPPEGTEVLVVQVEVVLEMQLPLTKTKVEQREAEH